MAIQHNMDITKVEAPSSSIVQLTFLPITLVVIWKDIWWDNLGLKFSKLKVIVFEFSRYKSLRAENKFLRYARQVCSTSKVDIAHGAWARYSTIYNIGQLER